MSGRFGPPQPLRAQLAFDQSGKQRRDGRRPPQSSAKRLAGSTFRWTTRTRYDADREAGQGTSAITGTIGISNVNGLASIGTVCDVVPCAPKFGVSTSAVPSLWAESKALDRR
jgi:hypothetical protein